MNKRQGKGEAALNEKFWDLNKIKQRSMIGGALKVFARDGFRHASTDEIVLEAGISKGLLFHYFYNKTDHRGRVRGHEQIPLSVPVP